MSLADESLDVHDSSNQINYSISALRVSLLMEVGEHPTDFFEEKFCGPKFGRKEATTVSFGTEPIVFVVSGNSVNEKSVFYVFEERCVERRSSSRSRKYFVRTEARTYDDLKIFAQRDRGFDTETNTFEMSRESEQVVYGDVVFGIVIVEEEKLDVFRFLDV